MESHVSTNLEYIAKKWPKKGYKIFKKKIK